MKIDERFRFIKSIIVSTKLKMIMVTAIAIYAFTAVVSVHGNQFGANTKEVLGGFSIKQDILSIYTLEWIVPKLLVCYILFVFIGNCTKNMVYLVVTRMKSKLNWFIIINLASLFIIIVWYLTGYLIVLTICKYKYGGSGIPLKMLSKMFTLDILGTYCIFNIFYLVSMCFYKIMLGIMVSLFIYISSMFTNNTHSIFFKLLFSNHEMYIRQRYLTGSYLYLILCSLAMLTIGSLVFKNRELSYEGV